MSNNVYEVKTPHDGINGPTFVMADSFGKAEDIFKSKWSHIKIEQIRWIGECITSGATK